MKKTYVILKWGRKILSLLFHDSRLVRAHAEDGEESILGNIYIGRVKNVAENIGAAFVEIQSGQPCFLGLKDNANPRLLNRAYGGRLLEGDELPVQVNREATKTKQPGVTTVLTLSGKYCVVTLGRPGIAWSSRLPKKDRARLSEELKETFLTVPKEFGVVVRTNAGELLELTPLKEELSAFTQKLLTFLEEAAHRPCHSLLYRREPAYLTELRDRYAGSYDEIVTDQEEIYEQIETYRREHPDHMKGTLRLYQDEMLSLYRLYSVESRLKEALSRKVWLKSGGYLVIEATEALTVIDVNSGKNVAKKDREDVFYLINKEAAEEIAAQLTLRNISGIIVIDFINMEARERRHGLMEWFGGLLKKDSVRTSLIDITALGLVEVTRMKINRPLWEQLREDKTCEASKSGT